MTDSRAIVRSFETEHIEKDDIVQLSRTIDSAEDLVKVCEETGATVRRTKTGYFVQGPRGTSRIPIQITRGRALENTIAQLRRNGIDLTAALPAQQRRRAQTEHHVEEEIPKMTVNGGRPTLAYDKPIENGSPTPAKTPTPLDVPSRPAASSPAAPAKAVTQADLDAVVELLAAQTRRLEETQARLEDHVRRLDGAERRLRAVEGRLDKAERALRDVGSTGGPSQNQFLRAKNIRDQILAWFRTLPTGMRVPPSVVAHNLCSDEDGHTLYKRQVIRLAEMGELQQHNEGGEGAGVRYHYSLPEKDRSSGNGA